MKHIFYDHAKLINIFIISKKLILKLLIYISKLRNNPESKSGIEPIMLD